MRAFILKIMKKILVFKCIAFLICLQQAKAQFMPPPEPYTVNTIFLKYSIQKGYNDIDALDRISSFRANIGNKTVNRPCYSFINYKVVDNFYHVMNDIYFYPPDITRYNYVDSTLFKDVALNQTQFLNSLKNKNVEQRKSYLKRTPVYVLDYDSRDVQGRVKILKVEPYYYDEHFAPAKELTFLSAPDPNAPNVLYLKYSESLNGKFTKESMIASHIEPKKKNRGFNFLKVYLFIRKGQLDDFGESFILGFYMEEEPSFLATKHDYAYVVPDKYENVSLDVKQLLNFLKSKKKEERKRYLESFKHIYLIDYDDKNYSDVRQKKMIEVFPKYDEDGYILVPM